MYQINHWGQSDAHILRVSTAVPLKEFLRHRRAKVLGRRVKRLDRIIFGSNIQNVVRPPCHGQPYYQ